MVTVIVAVMVVAVAVATLPPTSSANDSSTKIQVVAAENFWGSLVSQIGGTHVNVLSVVSDPNADPHEYTSNTSTAQAISKADYIIINGAGYDTWAENLISAGTKSNVKILNVADLLGKKEGDNPHFWYNINYTNQVVSQMQRDLSSIDSSNSAYYQQQYTSLNSSLAKYQGLAADIKQKFGGTQIAGTEDIVEYLANSTGLDVVSPHSFMAAVAEGNDPSAADVATFENQIQGKVSGVNVTVLVYNQQTVTPLTESVKAMAAQNGIPTVAITETIQPPNVSFQDWMYSELISLENALNAKTMGG